MVRPEFLRLGFELKRLPQDVGLYPMWVGGWLVWGWAGLVEPICFKDKSEKPLEFFCLFVFHIEILFCLLVVLAAKEGHYG